jgi:hypothetical protein
MPKTIKVSQLKEYIRKQVNEKLNESLATKEEVFKLLDLLRDTVKTMSPEELARVARVIKDLQQKPNPPATTGYPDIFGGHQ